MTLSATSSLYSNGTATITGPTSGSVTDQFGLIYTVDELNVANNVQVRATEVVVLGTPSDSNDATFSISGASSAMTNQLGHVWVGGIADWQSLSSVRTTNYIDASASPAPLWIGILRRSGTFNDVYGPMWCVGNAGTSDVAVDFAGPTTGAASTLMCPILATTEKTEVTGKINFGTATNPMVYYMMCDNDQLYSNDCEWGGTGTFYGLMVVMEACLVISDGNGVTPNVVGAVFNGTPYKSGTTDSIYDIELDDASTVAYSQAVIDAVSNTAITTMTTTTQIVSGSWQQLQ